MLKKGLTNIEVKFCHKEATNIISVNKTIMSAVSPILAEYFNKSKQVPINVLVSLDVVTEALQFLQSEIPNISNNNILAHYHLSFEWNCELLQKECIEKN